MCNRIITNIEHLAKIAFPEAMAIERSQKHISIVLDKKGKVLSFGKNGVRTHPEAWKKGYRFAEVHSELDAFLRLPKERKRDKDLVLLNFRFNRFGELRISRPCLKCMPWCEAIFGQIIYSMNDGFVHLKRDKSNFYPIHLDRKMILSTMVQDA